MKTEDMIDIINKFDNVKVLVIGDMMLDKYSSGSVKKISPEAPVPIIVIKKQEFKPGGAANVAANITSLGARCSIVGIVGDDEPKRLFLKEMDKRNIERSGILTDSDKPTTVKERVIAKSQHLLRIDFEENSEIGDNHTKEMSGYIKKSDCDIIVVSDYAKGVINERIMEEIRKTNKKIIVDPKPKNTRFYKNCYIMTPNEEEAEEMHNYIHPKEKDLEKIGKNISKIMNAHVLITKGAKGMSLFENGAESSYSITTKAKEIYDITGAGDTVVAVLSLCIAAGSDLKTASVISNYAAGIVVGKLGTSTLTKEELIEAIKNESKKT